MLTSRPAIFLDFDGVTHDVDHSAVMLPGDRFSFDRSMVFIYLAGLKYVLDKASAAVVISSSWRYHFEYEQLLEFCEPIREYIVGTTLNVEYSEDDVLPANRFEECELYAKKHGYGNNWLLIDDQEAIVWGYATPTTAQRSHVIITDEHKGLHTEGLLVDLHRWLKKQSAQPGHQNRKKFVK
jgi:hypothetical protein